MSRNIFGGIGISISTAVIAERSQVHQGYLADHLSGGAYHNLLAHIAQGLQGHGTPAAAALARAPNEVFTMLQTQEAVLAYIDVFWYTGLLALLLIPTALLMSGKSGPKKGAAA
jgi:DHA2 family multidrug resistance protein